MKVAWLWLACIVAACSGRMYDQDRPDQTRRTPLFEGQRLSRPAAAIDRRPRPSLTPPSVDAELLTRGREHYEIYCTPCHDAAGTGGGIVVQRGFPRPPSLHDAGQRQLSDRAMFDAIAIGKGKMAGFAAELTPRQCWGIVAYVRALQLSQDAAVTALSAAQRRRLDDTGGRQR